jgi:hypothetical protein
VGDKLTVEQQQALDDLVRLVNNQPPVKPPAIPPDASVRSNGSMSSKFPDFLETWLGISREETVGFVNDLVAQKDALQNRFLDWVERRPMDSAFEFLAAASMAFYAAEKEVNPRIKTYIDAFYYISTCASVGYADIFAMTQTGRTIAALVMIVGPALTSHALERTGVHSARQGTDEPGWFAAERKEKSNGHIA